MDNILNGNILILGSSSPRRQEILKMAGIPYELQIIPVDEIYPDSIEHKDVPIYLSELKANAFKGNLQKRHIVCTADTVVLYEGQLLGKPKTFAEAKTMLTNLSGNTHEVVTGVTLMSNEKKVSFSESSLVTLFPLSADEVTYYINTFKPYDKAGAYGIQEWMGFNKIEKIIGSYHNIMGLPMAALYHKLKDFS